MNTDLLIRQTNELLIRAKNKSLNNETLIYHLEKIKRTIESSVTAPPPQEAVSKDPETAMKLLKDYEQ